MASSLVSLDYGSDASSDHDHNHNHNPPPKQSPVRSSKTPEASQTHSLKASHESDSPEKDATENEPLSASHLPLFSSLPAPKNTGSHGAKKAKSKAKAKARAKSQANELAADIDFDHTLESQNESLPAVFFDPAHSGRHLPSKASDSAVAPATSYAAKIGALNPRVEDGLDGKEGTVSTESREGLGHHETKASAAGSAVHPYPAQYTPAPQNHTYENTNVYTMQETAYGAYYPTHAYPGYNLPVDAAYSPLNTHSFSNASSLASQNPVRQSHEDISKFIPQNERKFIKQGGIDVVDINQRDVSNSVWVPTDAGRMKSLGHGSSAAKKQLSRVAKSRNHIRSLAVLALEKEYELEERNSSSQKTKAETRGKYGW